MSGSAEHDAVAARRRQRHHRVCRGRFGVRRSITASWSISAELYDVPTSKQLRAGVERCLSGELHCAPKKKNSKIFKLELVTSTTCTGRQEGILGLRWSRLQSLQRSCEEQEPRVQRSPKLRRAAPAEEICRCSSGSLCSGQWAEPRPRGIEPASSLHRASIEPRIEPASSLASRPASSLASRHRG